MAVKELAEAYDDMKKEYEAAQDEVVNLKKDLATSEKEKDALEADVERLENKLGMGISTSARPRYAEGVRPEGGES